MMHMDNTNTFSAIFWDIDGTLIDSEPTHQAALIACVRHYGIDEQKIPQDRFTGMHMQHVWAELQNLFPPETTYRDWNAVIEQSYMQRVDQIAPMPEAPNVVQTLGKSYRQCAVSNSGRNIVDANIRRLGIEKALFLSVSLDDVKRGKPDPQPYLLAIDALNIEACQGVAIEDSRSGLQSAKTAGLTTIAFRNPDLPADAHINELAELEPLLNAPGSMGLVEISKNR